MPNSASSATDATPARKLRAYAVHVYTASGIVFCFLSVAELLRPEPDPRMFFLWNVLAGLVDATDGPFARRWQVKRYAAHIDGRTIDDIIDYQTFTFLPLVLVWRMGWLPEPAALWVCVAMLVSLLGFANTGAKQEAEGFFLGFPSYWNIYAFYAGLWYSFYGPLPGLLVLLALVMLTVLPVRFLYPNLAPHPWKLPVMLGAAAWMLLLLAFLPAFPDIPRWLVWLSLLYPAFYTALSVYLDRTTR